MPIFRRSRAVYQDAFAEPSEPPCSPQDLRIYSKNAEGEDLKDSEISPLPLEVIGQNTDDIVSPREHKCQNGCQYVRSQHHIARVVYSRQFRVPELL